MSLLNVTQKHNNNEAIYRGYRYEAVWRLYTGGAGTRQCGGYIQGVPVRGSVEAIYRGYRYEAVWRLYTGGTGTRQCGGYIQGVPVRGSVWVYRLHVGRGDVIMHK
jgi:hypothetical protein